MAHLPALPRATRQALSPIATSFGPTSPTLSASSVTPTEKSSPQSLIATRPRRRDSLIFVNATIPLSPPASPTSSAYKEQPFAGLTPRKRNPFARLFSCFGREERARKRALWASEFEKVGEERHWSEL